MKKYGSVLCIVLLLFSCSQVKRGTPDSSSGAGSNVLVGFAMDTLVVDRWRVDRDEIIKAFRKRGMDVIVTDGRNSADLQAGQIAELVNQNISLLLIIPNDSLSSAQAIIPAQRKGIPVISYDRLVEKGNTDAYVSFDNEKTGYLIMKNLLEKADSTRKVNLLIINGSPKDHNSRMLRKGAEDALKEKSPELEYEIAGETWVENWSSDRSYSFVSEVLGRTHNIQIIWAANDSLAGAAVRALAEYRMADQVLVGGQDADLDACQRIAEGTQTVTIYKPIDLLAEKTAALAEDLIHRVPAKGQVELINDGLGNVAFYKVDVYPVLRENLESTVISSGFHDRNLVYQNLSR